MGCRRRKIPEQTEGPFLIQSPIRSDIREDRSGLPLSLRLQVVEADGCQPVESRDGLMASCKLGIA